MKHFLASQAVSVLGIAAGVGFVLLSIAAAPLAMLLGAGISRDDKHALE